MKLFKWVLTSFLVMFITGCAVDIRPHGSHYSRVYYDTWDHCEPGYGVYIEGFYNKRGYYGYYNHRSRDDGYSGRHCR